MLPTSWTTLAGIGCLALGATACGGFRSSYGAAARVPMAPAGVYVDDDVADGYGAYAGALASAGRWDADPTYGVHWCPARGGEDAAFRPYVSHGHWATSEQPTYGAPPGTPYWASDDAAPWTEITTHRGWWIDLGLDHWCWVPGVKETPARVVWRSDDAFVGWAPEPPVWIDDGDESASAGFEWSFELLGTLLEDAADGVDGYLLTGDTAQAAARATSPSGRPDGSGPGFSKRAPAKPVVDSAHQQLVAYVSAHPNEGLAAAATASGRSASSTASSSSGGTGSSGSHPKASDASKTDGLPPASALVTAMMSDPTMAPVGVVRLVPYGASTGTATSGPSSASGGSRGATAWTASRGGSFSSSVHASSYGASSHGRSVSFSSSSSSSHHGSSGGSSSGHSSSGHSSSSHGHHR